MQVLGYPATWPTTCFIVGGCGAAVFAHTNGYGDFVLFDGLGFPWQVHDCYINRYLLGAPRSGAVATLRSDRLSDYRSVAVPAPPPRQKRNSDRDIAKMDPADDIGKSEILVAGYVQDYHERQVDRMGDKLGSLGQRVLFRVLGAHRSQLTIVTSDLKSYTVFADLSSTVVQRKDMIVARLQALRVVGLKGTRAVYLADDLLLVRGEA